MTQMELPPTPRDLRYGNWIRRRILWRLGLLAAAFGFVAVVPIPTVIRIIAGILSLITMLILIIPLYSYFMFSPRGGNLQERVYELVIQLLGEQEQGTILDIGTGNGVLAVKLAIGNPSSQVTGTDCWGEDWEYAREICEENSRIANVSSRVQFVKGDAAALDFPDETFDAVVSNLTFHEVETAPVKSAVVAEALRVLRPGGAFAFVDYFFESKYYGPAGEFDTFLLGLRLHSVALRRLGAMIDVPAILRHPRALGRVGILFGEK
jgi:ubiquinone/menaquinone biosynthesis C-methylase UbiE